ncbi:MAG: hypothetical protein IKP00_09925 [Victivallales bacterium]|nr:hypothetical protein [Victivallales bacterium]
MKRILCFALPLLLLVAGCATTKGPQFASLPDAKEQVAEYYEKGDYIRDVTFIMRKATQYIQDVAKSKQYAKPAIVLDVDDTALDTYEYQRGMGFGHNGKLWHTWIAMKRGKAIPPVLEFAKEAERLGYAIFFVSGRREAQREDTELNLKAVGYPQWTQFFSKPDNYRAPSVIPYKTECRRKIEEQGYTIVANIGDMTSDLDGGYALECFLLPNYIYEVK